MTPIILYSACSLLKIDNKQTYLSHRYTCTHDTNRNSKRQFIQHQIEENLLVVFLKDTGVRQFSDNLLDFFTFNIHFCMAP